MSIDAIALLHVSATKARKSVPDPARVTRLGPNACGVSLHQKHLGLEVRLPQAAAFLRAEVGDALALHHDPRGVLLVPALLAAPALQHVMLRATAITAAGLARLRTRLDLDVTV
jgi:hypothetical protein